MLAERRQVPRLAVDNGVVSLHADDSALDPSDGRACCAIAR
jgi:hypothetical protein